MNSAHDGPGKGAIGWLCSYVPEELILAAGLRPMRIVGQVERVKEADSYMFPNFCPYLKNVLDSGLRGEYKDLDGIIFTNSCDAARRLYDLWTDHVKTPFTYMLEVPRNRDDNAIRFFSEQLSHLSTRLEEFSGAGKSAGALGESIGYVNEQRSLMTSLFETQKGVPSPLKGSELLALCLETLTSSKERATEKLKEVTAQSATANPSTGKLPRVLVTGNVIDTPDLFEMVEAAGASVVTFDTCTGLRHWSGLVEEESDPIQSLARRYLLKPLCPRMPGLDQRIEQIAGLIREYAIDGVIYSAIKFCDYGLFDAPMIEAGLQDLRLPFLVVENDYVWGDKGRVQTRIEAFVEMMADDLD